MRELFAFPLLVSVLLSLTEVVVAEKTRIFSAILPIPLLLLSFSKLFDIA